MGGGIGADGGGVGGGRGGGMAMAAAASRLVVGAMAMAAAASWLVVVAAAMLWPRRRSRGEGAHPVRILCQPLPRRDLRPRPAE